ncbi:hypothetical protein DRQ33_07515 [bacterium]|nr:MAG: hypothetical protein DRQ33_07515 [bacterium]
MSLNAKRVSLIFLFGMSVIFAIQVAPGCFTIQKIPLGYPQDMGFSLVCSDVTGEYVIAQIVPPEIEVPGCESYRSLPDTSWFKIGEGETLYVDSTGYARSKMWVEIPQKPELYNQHFVVRIYVTSSANGIFQPAIMVNYFIETPALAEPPVPPAGKLGVAPSVLNIDPDNPVMNFTIYNNDSVAHKYDIAVRTPIKQSRRFANVSPAFSPIPDTSQISISPGQISIPPNDNRSVHIRWLSVSALSESSEAILLITADDGTQNFVRVKLEIEN